MKCTMDAAAVKQKFFKIFCKFPVHLCSLKLVKPNLLFIPPD